MSIIIDACYPLFQQGITPLCHLFLLLTGYIFVTVRFFVAMQHHFGAHHVKIYHVSKNSLLALVNYF